MKQREKETAEELQIVNRKEEKMGGPRVMAKTRWEKEIGTAPVLG